MQIGLVVHLEFDDEDGGEERIYRFMTERPYSRVPMAGEMASLDDGLEGDGEIASTISFVSWMNDGTAHLEFEERAAEGLISEEWLLSAGYERVDDGAFGDEEDALE